MLSSKNPVSIFHNGTDHTLESLLSEMKQNPQDIINALEWMHTAYLENKPEMLKDAYTLEEQKKEDFRVNHWYKSLMAMLRLMEAENIVTQKIIEASEPKVN